MNKQHDKIIDHIKNNIKEAENMDKRQIDNICRSVFKFTANTMRNSEDYRPVRLRYLGVFAVMKGKEKK